MVTEYSNQTFDEFKNSNPICLYHCTSHEGAEGIMKNGACREFTGKHSNYYGQGFYTTFTLHSTTDNQGSLYGSDIIKFGLIDGFKNFLFFDEEMNEKYNNGKPLEQQIEELCPPKIVEKLKQNNFFQVAREDRGLHYSLRKPLSAQGAKMFFEILKGDSLSRNNLTPYQVQQGCHLYDELDISKTKVRGYVFVGSNDGEVAVVRDFHSLIPLEHWDPYKGQNPADPNDSGWEDISSEENYNNIVSNSDAAVDIRGRFPETAMNEKTICGYILVKGNPPGKYNYLNVETNELLLPVGADRATAFDADSHTAKFEISGNEYEYYANSGIFCEDGCFTYTKDEFEQELRENGILTEGLNKIKSLMGRILVL